MRINSPPSIRVIRATKKTRRHQPPNTSGIECSQTQSPSRHRFVEELRCDQKAGNDEENIDADMPAETHKSQRELKANQIWRSPTAYGYLGGTGALDSYWWLCTTRSLLLSLVWKTWNCGYWFHLTEMHIALKTPEQTSSIGRKVSLAIISSESNMRITAWIESLLQNYF